MLRRISRTSRLIAYPRRAPHRIPRVRAYVVPKGATICAPGPGYPGDPGRAVNLHPHPADPASHFRAPPPPQPESQASTSTVVSSTPAPPPPDISHGGSGPPSGPPIPSRAHMNSSPPPTYQNPPFHTHKFVAVLEKVFPTETARSLMRATRALLVDRIGRVRREALTAKDLENQAYLFRAALSELRAEVTTFTRNESAIIRTSVNSQRREFDVLEGRAKQSIDTMKHEIQMELDTRKTEGKADLKRQDIDIESLQNKYLIAIGDLRTLIEEIRWENMRRSVLGLSAFLLSILIGMELSPKPKPPPPPKPEHKQPEAEGLQRMDWVT